jgi:hypothetical protein
MPTSLSSFLIAGLGAAAATVFQHFFQRYAETRPLRRELVETPIVLALLREELKIEAVRVAVAEALGSYLVMHPRPLAVQEVF